jgi:hypothetical protein
MPITASSLALLLITALTPHAQQRDRDVVRVPGFNAIAGQHDVELLLSIDADIERALSAPAIETASMAQLRRAGLNVTKWVSSESRKPALRVSIRSIHPGGRASLFRLDRVLRRSASVTFETRSSKEG